MSSLEKAILKTLVYADIFGYPLTTDELYRYLIKTGKEKLNFDISTFENIYKNSNLSRFIDYKNDYIFLKKKDALINQRKKRNIFSNEKIEILEKIIEWLKLIPSVKMIGITGSLALKNADKDDDIDILVVSSNGLLWWTRLVVTLIVEFSGLRRHPSDKVVKNKICLNMFIDESKLAISFDKQDLYTAHEIIQMKPVYDRDNTYIQFLSRNSWVGEFLPYAIEINQEMKILKSYKRNFAFNLLEKVVKKMQLLYMEYHCNSEVIRDDIICFHTKDYRLSVLKKYYSKMKLISK